MAGENPPVAGAETGAPVAPVTAGAPILEVASAAPAVAEVVPSPDATAEPTTTEPAETTEAVEAKPEVAEAVAEEKPAEEVKVEGEKPAEEVKTEAEKPALPTYEAFKLPEGFDAAPEQLTEFGKLAGEAGLTQEAAQKFMDMHGAVLKTAVENLQKSQADAFTETRRKWVSDFDKQAGNRRDTILNDAKAAIAEVVKDPKARKAVFDALALTGAGDHPAVINAFAALGKKVRERPAPPSPTPNNGSRGLSKADRRYGAT